MLQNTFLHIPGYSENSEEALWKGKIMTWDEFIAHSKDAKAKEHILESKERLSQKDSMFFANHMLHRHHWRAYPDFMDKCCFLDIETTGLSRDYHTLTMIGVYNGTQSKVFIDGKNMDEFQEEIKKYEFMVTFNGYMFDVPFIRAKMPHVRLPHLHADLRFVLKSLGYTGGLKRIEKELGIKRSEETDGMDGFQAVRLWYKYKNGDNGALKKLIQYNIEDIENLKFLMEMSYSEF
ncbi:MAG: exonuclease [Nanoarchaeota archaeon]|nr:exonuclease [Nanoarchaeota archaeon]